jgi:hypothetical protein
MGISYSLIHQSVARIIKGNYLQFRREIANAVGGPHVVAKPKFVAVGVLHR